MISRTGCILHDMYPMTLVVPHWGHSVSIVSDLGEAEEVYSGSLDVIVTLNDIEDPV